MRPIADAPQVSPSSPAAAIEVCDLGYRYPGATRDALQQVSFTVEPGSRIGLLGPNGAGKSTLMRILCGYLPVQEPHVARVRVAGFDVATASLAVRRRVGYMPELVPLYPELRVEEHLAFRSTLKGVRRRARKAEVERVAALTGIRDKLHVPIAHLSRGYRQRVGLADALLGAPGLVVLDEPTVGLDPNQVQDIRAMLRDMGGRQTLVFSSHLLAEVELLCDRVIILAGGRIVAHESLAEAMRTAELRVAWQAERARVLPLVERWRAQVAGELGHEAFEWQDEGGGAALRVALPAAVALDVAVLMAAFGELSQTEGVALRRLEAGRSRLEQRFAAVTGGAP